MADSERQEHDNILSGDANLVNTTHMVQVSSAAMGGGVEVSEDILRQAFQEASGPLVQDGVAYANGEVVADATNAIPLDGTGVISGVKSTDVIYTLHNASQNVTADDNSVQDLQGLVDSRLESSDNSGFLQEVVAQDDSQHAVVSASGDNYVIRLQNQSSILQGGLVTVASSENVLEPLQSTVQESGLSQLEATQVNNQAATSENKVQTIIVQAPSTTNTAPLGSSANPIRIVQQGNQYTSLQQLSAEQLSHIMQVVQQQQLMKLTTESNKPSVIFNPQTQTRIVYKVMYPSELHNRNKNSSASESTFSGRKQPHQICVPTESVLVSLPKRTYKKRKHKEDEKVEAPEMSKEEKEEKKKHRPRTRSGRISRPPKHMVKDYKHIHPVDWDEDYDDSDGGYSDFKGSSGDEDEPDSRRRKKDSSYTAYSCLGPHGKAKPWKCKVCEKAYIGKAGLARHYRLNPEHGKDDENFKEGFYVNGMDDSSSRDSAPDLADKKAPSQTNGQDQDGVRTSFANCSVINTSTTNSTPTAATTTAATNSSKSHSPIVMPGKSLLKNKQGLPQENATAKKKARLKEYIREFTDEDLMETVFPRLAQAVSTWEFMLMKAERGRPARPHLVHLLQEYVQVYREIRRLCEEQLQLVPPGAPPSSGTRIQVSDEKVANALGVSIGLYAVHTKPAKEDPFHYKLLTADPSTCNTNPLSNKRTLEMVSTEDLIETKQDKHRELNNSVNHNKATSQTAAKVLPGQTLLKPDLLSTADAVTKPSMTDGSMADAAQSESSITVTTTQTQDSYPTGSIHQMAPLESPVVTTQGNIHDFNVVNVKSESDMVASSAIIDSHGSSFVDNHSSTSPMLSVCFVSTSSVTSSTMANAMNSESMNEQSMEIEEQQDQSLDNSDMIKMHTEEYDKAENQLMDEAGHLLQPSEPSVEHSENSLKHTNEQELEHQEQLMHQSNKTLQSSEQLQEQSSLQADTEHLIEHADQPLQHSDQSLQQSEQLLNHSEQQEEQQNQLVEHSTELLKESSKEVEQHQHLLQQTGELPEPSNSIAENSEQLAGEFQLDASQLTAGVTMSVPSDSMNYSSQYIDSEMGQHFVSDGMILTDQGNGQMLLQENILIDQNAEQSGSAQDINADNRLILIKNPDGTIQVHRQGNQPISMEELQALLGVEIDANLLTSEASDEVLQ